MKQLRRHSKAKPRLIIKYNLNTIDNKMKTYNDSEGHVTKSFDNDSGQYYYT